MIRVFLLLLLASTYCGAVGQDAPASDDEDHAQSCLLQHSKHKPAERIEAKPAERANASQQHNASSPAERIEAKPAERANASQQHNASSPKKGEAHSWRVLGITKYSIVIEGSWTSWWYSNNDVYAWVTLKPQGLTFKSKVLVDSDKGDLDLHIYVSDQAESAEIELHDQGTFKDTSIGTLKIDLSASQKWCSAATAASSGCTFSKSLESSWASGSTVEGYLAAGSYLDTQVAALHKRGIGVEYQDSTRTMSKFQQFRIKNDEVEKEISFAKTGSAYPSVLHGIWWMDQRGRNMPIPSDPSYKQVCATAADELLVSFGQGTWDPKTRCVTGLSVYGAGPFHGQWTWFDDTGNGSTSWASDNTTNAVYDFCFEDETMQTIDIWTRISVNSVLNDAIGVVPFTDDVVVAPPEWITNVRMEKKPWGWDRRTTVGPAFLRALIRNTLGGILGNAGFVGGGLECHYPLFQIVDGDGKRTENYAAYLEFANNQTTCKTSSFDCPPNVGKGTTMTGRLVGP